MANFAYVQDSTVVDVYDQLPDSWENYSNFSALADDMTTLNSLGWYTVTYQAPEYDNTLYRLGALTYTFDGTQVIESNNLDAIPQQDAINAQWQIVRDKRDALISEIDWRYIRYAREARLNLTPIDDITKLDTYTQALADLPETQTDPFNIIWPTL
jgi:Phage tail assembly chaperone protein